MNVDELLKLYAIGERNFSGVYLHEVYLYEAELIGANLYEADLIGANLSKAKLNRVNFGKANLCKINLMRADLGGADPHRSTFS